MNARSMPADQVNFDVTEAGTPAGALALLKEIARNYCIAREVQREARQLYALDDSKLAELGLSRDGIHAKLVQRY